MPAHDDEDMLDHTERDRIDDLLAQDRQGMLRAANARIAGGMYVRIARTHAERNSVVASRWQWQILVVAVASAVLAAVWITMPRRSALPAASPSAQLPLVAPSRAPIAEQSPVRTRVRRVAPLPSGTRLLVARSTVPRQPTFPMNVAPTEQELLLMQVASRSAQEQQAIAEAIADAKSQGDKQTQEFDQWLQQRGGKQ